MRNKKRGFFCALLWMGFFCAILFAGVHGERGTEEQTAVAGEAVAKQEEPSFSLYAQGAVLLDADSGRVLYGKNADEPMAMASTTKIMTCILVLEYGELDDVVSVSAYASGMPKVKLSMRCGEQYSVRSLLMSLMLESHNDSAVALAEYIGKRYLPEELQNKDTAQYTVEESKRAVSAFAALMNQKAEALSCEDTWFITPNGLDATEEITMENGEMLHKEHHTTARDLARIMSYCICHSPKKELFLEITRTPSYSFTENGRSFSCNNHNAFLSMMEGALSGKTGFTNKAGYCYVGALERDDRRYVVALLACGWPNHKTYKWSDTRKLMEYGLEQYAYHSFREEGIAFAVGKLQPIQVIGGQTQRLGDTAYAATTIAPDEDPMLEGLLLREDEKVEVEYRQKKALSAPVRIGTEVGEVCYVVDGITYRRERVVTTDNVEKVSFPWCLEQIELRFLLP